MPQSLELLIGRLRDRVMNGPGRLDAAVRQAAYLGEAVPPAMAPYVDKVRDHAYKVVDADVDQMRTAGCSDDEVFEVTVATALGAGLSRLEAVIRAMEEDG